jgi:3-oxosteroid 1-dehydrogenase
MGSNGHLPRVRRGIHNIAWDRTTDIVVVGTGAAGCSTALNAAHAGANVVMLEKRETVGGTTAKSGGWFWMPNHRRMREAGIEDPRGDALRYMARLTRPESYDPENPWLGLPEWEYALIEAFCDNAAAADTALVEMDALRSVHAVEFPDYFAQLPENKAPYGRVLIPQSPEGELGTGADMIRMMMRAIERDGIDVLTEHPVVALVLDDGGRAVGVIAEHAGRRLAIGARQAVVFATGGYGQDLELRRQLLAGPILVACAASGSTGDFLRIAQELGLPLRNTGHPWMSPGILERGLRNRPDNEMTFQATGDSMIEVDRTGRRVTNEKLQYNEQTLNHWHWDAQRAQYTNLLLFMVWDQYAQDTFANDLPGNPIAPPGQDDGHIVSGADLPALAQALGERLAQLAPQTGGVELDDGFADRLAESIGRFNLHARAGADPDFHRGETPIETFFNSFHGPVRNQASPTMAPIADDGPYYATILAPGMLDSKGGPITDPDARILDGAGRPVPGLYGVGNCVASPSGKAYWAGGATLGPAITFGYLAARSAVREPAADLAVSAPA